MTRATKIQPRLRRVAMAALIAGLSAVAAGDSVIIKGNVDVLSDKDPLADPVATVSNNSKLEIIDKKGGWVHVRTDDGKEGYITTDQLPSATSLASVSGQGGSSGVDASLASRGLEPDTEAYAKAKSLNPADAQLAKDWGDAVSKDDLKAFLKAGHVGPKKHRN
jgi:hypothetical protein